MEFNQTPLDSELSRDLGLTSAAKSYLEEAAKWARFIAIVGFVFVGLFVLLALVVGFTASELIPGIGVSGGFFALLYIAMAALYFFPLLYLFRFADKTRYALQRSDSQELEVGIENLKANFKFVGILLLIVIGLYALLFVIGLFAGFASFLGS